jgi:signal transduction histidine kinase
VIGEVKSLLNVEGTSVLLRDPSSDDLIFAASTGANSEGLVGKRMPITDGIVGWAARERRPVWVTDAQHDSRFYRQVDATTSLTTRSVLAVPLMFKGMVWGVVEAINKTDGTFSQRDCEVLEALASSAAIAIENAQLYSSLRESNTQLQAALQAKDDMIRNVSHELRTPLGLIYGYVELLETGDLGPLTAKQERAVQTLLQQGDRLRFMVERLLALQSLDPQKMRWEQVDLSQWLRQALRPWEARIAKSKVKIELQLDVPPSLPPLIADPDFVGQIFGNLVDNAIKFSPQGGQVRVSARAESGQVIVAVADHGIGIPPDKLQQIFERFYQVDASSTRRYGGMGIGLALCRAIAEAHGGKVWAESAGNGQGSTFYVALPMMTTSGNVV